jgi:hypothetical protein
VIVCNAAVQSRTPAIIDGPGRYSVSASVSVSGSRRRRCCCCCGHPCASGVNGTDDGDDDGGGREFARRSQGASCY